MGMNPLGEEGVKAVLKGIASNHTLKLVGLEVRVAEVSVTARGKCSDRNMIVAF